MSRPWFPFYVGDYTRDTARLTTEAHGAYLLLMLDYWVNGAPPDDDETLATITKLPVTVWKKRRPMLVTFFKVQDGAWTHTRIEKEREKADTVGAANSDKARAAAELRWAKQREAERLASLGKCPDDAPSIDEALPQNAQSQSPSSSPSLIMKYRDIFLGFWEAYPRRDEAEQQERAETEFAKLVASGVDPAVITFGAKAYCAKIRKQNNYATKFVKVAWRWLGEQDFSGSAPVLVHSDSPVEPTETDWRAIVRRFIVNESTWPRSAGNAPGSRSCRCPAGILAEEGICPNTGLRIDETWWFAEEETPELRANLSHAADHRLNIRLYDITVDGVTKQNGAFFIKRIPPGYDEATGEKLAPSAEEDAA
jgi:uncharacterized protein YdaU (DUF1376 family)